MVSEVSVGGEFVAERPGDRRGGRLAGRDEGGDVLFQNEKVSQWIRADVRERVWQTVVKKHSQRFKHKSEVRVCYT